MVKILILGQYHQDPAPFVAAHAIVKKCVDNGVKVACAYEHSSPRDAYIEQTESDVIFRRAVAELDSPYTRPEDFHCRTMPFFPDGIQAMFRDKSKILNDTQGSEEKLALLKYLKDNGIEAAPLENEKLKKAMHEKVQQINAQASLIKVKTGSNEQAQQYFLQQFDNLAAEQEPLRIDQMVRTALKTKTQLEEKGHNDAVIVLFNIGQAHQERVAKHLKMAGQEAEVIQCNPHQNICFEGMQKEMQVSVARKKALEAKVDSPEIQNTKINVTPVTLHYVPATTQPQIASDYKTVTSVTLGDFDVSPLNAFLDQTIPSITITVDAAKFNSGIEKLVQDRGGEITLKGNNVSIQLRRDKFDVELRKVLGFDKVRLKNLDPEKLEAIQNLSPSIQLIPDTNFAKNAYLCLYPSELGEAIKAINTAKSTPAAQNAPNVEQGKWTSAAQNKGGNTPYLSK